MQKWIQRLANASAVGMFLILIMGALVTKTESGRGCGDDWPLCNGKFVPAYTISSFIEYSHRAVVGVVTLLLVLVTLLVFLYIRRKDARWYAVGSVALTLAQAVMGALAVVWPQSSAVLALHFGLSLLAFAFSLLLALSFTSWGDYAGPSPLGARFRGFIWLVLIYTYCVVYIGAFVRHTVSSGGCTGWPLCNGEWIPEMTGATGIVFAHRIAAALLLVVIVILAALARKQYAAHRKLVLGSIWALAFVILQVFSGALVTWSLGNELAYLLTGMIHAVIIACLFGCLSYLGVLTLYSRKG
ncbi:heme A synthase [Paenibacillus athensensis]|uniref:Heme A synthase n=1 Tax=Paenibacillus athensensis TaxID=1967502 RepID=A0A4Y8Q667_9BACL|nr:COX15/CtaA family protein [Paenibacillus athensensis]MCD1259799.1 heme A synthase [Paenibacillus athensensis]